MATLAYPTRISQSSTRKLNQNIITANYGDNNTQVAAWGRNSQWEEWSLEWNNLNQTERDAWMAFYATVGLYNVFYWAAPPVEPLVHGDLLKVQQKRLLDGSTALLLRLGIIPDAVATP